MKKTPPAAWEGCSRQIFVSAQHRSRTKGEEEGAEEEFATIHDGTRSMRPVHAHASA